MPTSFDIVGYTYKAEEFTPSGLREYLTSSTPEVWGWDASQDVEAVLDTLAHSMGIDRENEYSFDSDDFPKVVFRNQLS
jgi:hypothetical protein